MYQSTILDLAVKQDSCHMNVILIEHFSAKSEERKTIRFRIGHDTSSKQHNMSSSKFRCQMSVLQRVGRNMMPHLTQEVENSSNSLLDHA